MEHHAHKYVTTNHYRMCINVARATSMYACMSIVREYEALHKLNGEREGGRGRERGCVASLIG